MMATRQFGEANVYHAFWADLGMSTPPQLVGTPILEASELPSPDEDGFLILGNFSRYLIVDRIGIRTLRDPYTNKPFVKFYTTKRVGGGVQDFDAIKLLKFGTA